MATDDERREVAERLRVGADRQADHTMSVYLCLAVLGDDFAERFDRGELRRELFNCLADLIDPDCEEGRYSVARTVRPVDREALLETLSCMDAAVRWAGPDVERDIVEAWADDIRKALGEEVA